MALVWIWIMIWSAGGVDTCATFAPEYKDTVNDTRKALLSAALFSLVVYTILPIGLVGGVGAETVEAYDYVGALNQLVGSEATNFFVVVILASFIISMNTATADGSRALYGISKDGLSIKQLGRLNRWNVPGFAMTVHTPQQDIPAWDTRRIVDSRWEHLAWMHDHFADSVLSGEELLEEIEAEEGKG